MENGQDPQKNKKQRNRKTNKIILSVIGGVILLIIVISVIANAASKKTKGDNTGSGTSEATSQTSGSNGSSTLSATPSKTTGSSTTPASCYTASQAASEKGQSGCVQFTGYAYTSGSGQMYLDQSTSAPYGFSAWIPAGTSGGSSIINEYSGKDIDVTGSIVNYNGEPEIEVTSASQITLAQ